VTTKQEFGLYLTWSGYAAALVTVILAAKHLPILIFASAAVVCVFIGRQLEKV
jgi:membrane protein implicated in regulation of membrane protease activity